MTLILIVIGALGTVNKRSVQGLEDLEVREREESIVEIDLNTKKSPVYLRRLAVNQTPVENHQLTMVWKILKIEE